MRKRVLLVGAGRRGQNAFLPIFRCLEHLFDLRGIVARNAERLAPVARKWELPAITNLDDYDLSEIDLVVMSVATNQNANVLRKLLPHAGHLHVVIDTPIAWSRQEMGEIAPLLAQFAGATVAEDHMNFPFHTIARTAVADGVIGVPRSVTLLNIGYLYHGLAIIRSFAGFPEATGSWRKEIGTLGNIMGFEFPDGFTGTIVGPYRRQDKVGGLLVEGSAGIITESAVDTINIGRKTFLLQPERAEGLLTGYRITGPGYGIVKQLPNMAKMREMDFADKSEINLIQNCALIDVLVSVFHEFNINRNYGYKQGLYDSFASQRVNNGFHKLTELNLGLN